MDKDIQNANYARFYYDEGINYIKFSIFMLFLSFFSSLLRIMDYGRSSDEK